MIKYITGRFECEGGTEMVQVSPLRRTLASSP